MSVSIATSNNVKEGTYSFRLSNYLTVNGDKTDQVDTLAFMWKSKQGKAEACIRDMVFGDRLRGQGIGSLMWRMVYDTLPVEVRDNFYISGVLSPVDDESSYRKPFWSKIIGIGIHSDSYYDDIKIRRFSGRLTPENIESFPKINVKPLN